MPSAVVLPPVAWLPGLVVRCGCAALSDLYRCVASRGPLQIRQRCLSSQLLVPHLHTHSRRSSGRSPRRLLSSSRSCRSRSSRFLRPPRSPLRARLCSGHRSLRRSPRCASARSSTARSSCLMGSSRGRHPPPPPPMAARPRSHAHARRSHPACGSVRRALRAVRPLRWNVGRVATRRALRAVRVARRLTDT